MLAGLDHDPVWMQQEVQRTPGLFPVLTALKDMSLSLQVGIRSSSISSVAKLLRTGA